MNKSVNDLFHELTNTATSVCIFVHHHKQLYNLKMIDDERNIRTPTHTKKKIKINKGNINHGFNALLERQIRRDNENANPLLVEVSQHCYVGFEFVTHDVVIVPITIFADVDYQLTGFRIRGSMDGDRPVQAIHFYELHSRLEQTLLEFHDAEIKKRGKNILLRLNTHLIKYILT